MDFLAETQSDIDDIISFINQHPIQGLKVHSTYVIKHTMLASMFKKGEYKPISLDYYLNTLTYILSHIRPDIVIHRISGDAPKELLLAPDWNLHKKWVLNGLDKKLREENLWQGKFYTK